jgi:hypothetical protein
MTDNLGNFIIGQPVVWQYQAHGAMSPIQYIHAEVVKLGAKKVQIKIKGKDNGEILKRWVNSNKLVKANG